MRIEYRIHGRGTRIEESHGSRRIEEGHGSRRIEEGHGSRRIEEGHGSGIEVVRCYGNDEVVVLPNEIDGLPVTHVAAYAFSARKREEETDVFSFETDGHGLCGEEEQLLAGECITEVILPKTVESIGNYIFYGCKQLRSLEFSDALMQIGSGAFTGCGRLRWLRVHLQVGEKSCVKEILGELWQRMDVTFYKGGQKIRLVFPEHYEEAVENTPARILFTQHHGTGNNYRQCFYNKEMDYRKYDELFPLAVAQDREQVLADLVLSRLESGYELTAHNEGAYVKYAQEHLGQIVAYLIEKERLDWLALLSGKMLWRMEVLDQAIQLAAAQKKTELVSYLMNERHVLQLREDASEDAGEDTSKDTSEDASAPLRRNRRKFAL